MEFCVLLTLKVHLMGNFRPCQPCPQRVAARVCNLRASRLWHSSPVSAQTVSVGGSPSIASSHSPRKMAMFRQRGAGTKAAGRWRSPGPADAAPQSRPRASPHCQILCARHSLAPRHGGGRRWRACLARGRCRPSCRRHSADRYLVLYYANPVRFC